MMNTPSRLELRLKEREDEYTTYKQFYVLVGTFNVNNRLAPTNILLEQWFHQIDISKERHIPDIIAVGFQEIDTSSGAYIYDDKKKEIEWNDLVRKTIQSCYKDNTQYELLKSIRLMGILLFVYVQSAHLPKCSLISCSSVPTGFMGLVGNKGGVGVRFRFYESDICFVNSHFASGDGQTQRRNDDYQTIESRMAFTDASAYNSKDYLRYAGVALNSNNVNIPNTQNPSTSTQWWKISDHDIVFWCGDLNYRISHANEQVRKAISELSTIPLHEKDQLRCEMQLERVFVDYYEPPIDFLPTYKFDINTDIYDTSEKSRTPSWTDRILYRSKRPKVLNDNQTEIDTIRTIRYTSANDIKFSDHRPVSGLYLVNMKYECDRKRSNFIREELIREFDRLENESIPTIEVSPRPPEIIFNRIRYLDKPNYLLTIKNTGECPCTCMILPSSLSASFSCLEFLPSLPYTINAKQSQHVKISFNGKNLNRTPISEILILHVENGADTFITLDITFDKGPFGLSLDEFPVTLYDNKKKTYVYSIEDQTRSDDFMEMKKDPPVLFIALFDHLKQRSDVDLLNVFSNETQDSLDLIPLRDQIYENNYYFDKYKTEELFMILLYLLQSLQEPLISDEIQDKVFSSLNKINLNDQENVADVVSIIIEDLKPKERSLFFHFFLLIKNCWPTKDQMTKFGTSANDILNAGIDVLAVSILHEHLDRNQRHTFILACLSEINKN